MRFWGKALIYGVVMGSIGLLLGLRGWQLAVVIIADAILCPLLDLAIPDKEG